MSESLVLVEQAPVVRTLTLNRPRRSTACPGHACQASGCAAAAAAGTECAALY